MDPVQTQAVRIAYRNVSKLRLTLSLVIFAVGLDNRKETSFEPKNLQQFSHTSAQNPSIIAQVNCLPWPRVKSIMTHLFAVHLRYLYKYLQSLCCGSRELQGGSSYGREHGQDWCYRVRPFECSSECRSRLIEKAMPSMPHSGSRPTSRP